jgi:hypothetical protein
MPDACRTIYLPDDASQPIGFRVLTLRHTLPRPHGHRCGTDRHPNQVTVVGIAAPHITGGNHRPTTPDLPRLSKNRPLICENVDERIIRRIPSVRVVLNVSGDNVPHCRLTPAASLVAGGRIVVTARRRLFAQMLVEPAWRDRKVHSRRDRDGISERL